jgi:hypothetical protein
MPCIRGIGLLIVSKVNLLSWAQRKLTLHDLRQAAHLSNCKSGSPSGPQNTSAPLLLSPLLPKTVNRQIFSTYVSKPEIVPVPACISHSIACLFPCTAWTNLARTAACGKAPWRLTWRREIHTQREEREEEDVAVPTNTEAARKEQTFVDRVRVEVKAGDGGSGCVSMWKSQAKGTYDGQVCKCSSVSQ